MPAELPSPDPATPADPGPRRFSRELLELAVRFTERPVTLEDLLEVGQGRSANAILILLSLPFLTPIPLPGVSMPVGALVVVMGSTMALGRRPWVPRWLCPGPLPVRWLPQALAAAGRVVRVLEWGLRPRWTFLPADLCYRRLVGVMTAGAGLLLLLPLPVPFSNGLPAWTILLLSAAAVERDGVCLLAGCLLFALTLGFFLLLALGGAAVWDYLRHWMNAMSA